MKKKVEANIAPLMCRRRARERNRPPDWRGFAFSKAEQMRKIIVALAINVWFFGRVRLTQ
jgi:hypothetical protein